MTTAAEEVSAQNAKIVRANPNRAGRSVTMSRHGIVASEHVLASQAGLDMLRSGGSAMDAAVATAAVLNVVEPMMTGMGGDAWFLYFEAKTGKVHALNGSGRSPSALTREYFEKKNASKIDDASWEAVTVPGAVDAWSTGHAKFGKKPWAEVLAPAIRYAEEGAPVSEIVDIVWKFSASSLKKDQFAKDTYLVNGKAPEPGEVFKNPRLAKSLLTIAEGGRDAFYKGPIAQEIARYAQATGGFFSIEDFAGHSSTWVDPISTNYRGYDVYQCPPNGQGAGVLMMLNILEGFDLKSMPYASPEYFHLLIEAKKLAYADLYKFVADPTKAKVPTTGLLSKEYAGERRKLFDPKTAAAAVEPGVPKDSDTTYLTVIDAEGNACSFINSLYAAFGSKIVGGETGIVMQNRGAGFTLEKGHYNEYAPGKRPYHTIIPGMVLKGGKLYMSYGLMGGDMQPQGHVQFLTNHIDFGMGIQEAVDAPRWRHEEGLKVAVEAGIKQETFDALKALGHVVHWSPFIDFGGSQVVLVDPATGTYFGASDPRKDGAALGY
jgi:gamma-glutamyltranspeptidase/glutathione hydrolase